MDVPWFLYSQDLSNYKTRAMTEREMELFLYSQDLSNYKTLGPIALYPSGFCTLKI